MYTETVAPQGVSLLREFTAIITKEQGQFLASCLELGLERISAESVEEARDRLISAMQRHIDDLCETEAVLGRQPARPSSPSQRPTDHAFPLTLKVPEYLITRN